MADPQTIRVIFTDATDSAFDQLVKNYNLKDTPEEIEKRAKEKRGSRISALTQLIKNFSLELINEKSLTESIIKETNFPPETAQKITQEIIIKIVPTLEKAPEENFTDPAFGEKVSAKIFKNSSQQQNTITQVQVKNPQPSQAVRPKSPPPKKDLSEYLNRPEVIERQTPAGGPARPGVIPPKNRNEDALPRAAAPQRKTNTGPDSYREPLE